MTCITRKARLARTNRLARSLTNRSTSGSTSKSCASAGHSELRVPFPYQSRLFFQAMTANIGDSVGDRSGPSQPSACSPQGITSMTFHSPRLPTAVGRLATRVRWIDHPRPMLKAGWCRGSRLRLRFDRLEFLLDDPAVRWMVRSRTDAGHIMRGRSPGRRFVRLPRQGPCRCTRSAPACCGRRRPVPAK